ncbi:hypothetical protein OROGR_006207 [Orobanche gracilis]
MTISQMPAKQSPSTAPTASKPELTSVRHTVPGKVGSLSKVSKPEVNFSSPLNNSNSSKQMDNHGNFHQKLDAKFFSAGNSYGKSTDTPAARYVPRNAGQTPKGISFLSNTGTSFGDTSKHELDGSTTDVPIKPRGINLLSFVRPTLDDSSNKTLYRLLSNSNNETRNSTVSDLNGGKPTCSLPESVGILKVNTQINQNATNLDRDLNGKVNGTVWTVPQRRSFSSFDTIINGRSNLHFKDDTAFLSVKESQSIPSKLQGPIRMCPLSFGRPPDQSKGGLTANSSMSFKTSFLSNTPSSVQKAVQSTLAFAANFEADIKVGTSLHQLGS